MMNELNFKVFHEAFSSRIEVNAAIRDALQPPADNLERLKEAVAKLESVVSEIGRGEIEDQYRAYLTVTKIFFILAQWKHAIRDAEPDAQRFLASARIKASEVDRKVLDCASDQRLVNFLDQVVGHGEIVNLIELKNQILHWNLPILLFAEKPTQNHSRFPASKTISDKPKKLDTTVAFLKFDIDGKAAQKWNYLVPGTTYELTIEVRVSNWPKGAKTLTLMPLTIDAREQGWFPVFKFEKPGGDGPFTVTGTKRAVLEMAHSFGSRPYEFKYAAEFDDTSACREVAIVGHRQLRLEGTDIVSKPITGFSNVDRHLLKLRDRLRTLPGLHANDLANTMILLGGLGNIAAQALRQGLFVARTSESVFQDKATELLRSRSEIGEHLQSHQEAAGGITDLTYKDIPIELKVENDRVLNPKDFIKYFDQTAAYALGLGKKIGVLCVLEASTKSAPVGTPEDDIDVFTHQTGHSSLAIVVVVVRGGFPKPSSYSRSGNTTNKSDR